MCLQLGSLLVVLSERQSSKTIHENSIGMSANIRAHWGISWGIGDMLNTRLSTQMKKTFTNGQHTIRRHNE
jgi:hypothetical protein